MKDKYKHLLNFAANIISLAVEACMFGWVWYMLYIPMLDKANTFFNRGNWAVIGMYVLFVFFFTKIFGGYRIGYMRISDIILSQILAVVLAMIVAYFEICLVANDYLPPQPLLLTRRIQTCICLSHQYDPRNDKYNLCYRHQKQWQWFLR